MNNPYLLGAFILVAIVFIIHHGMMTSRRSRLERRLEDLKSQARDL
jgi:hypothetical protein